MNEILTGELTGVLTQTGPDGVEQYRKEYLEPLGELDFRDYYLSLLRKKGRTRSQAAANSGIEVHYAYQILNGTKKPGRDKLLCLCIGGGLTLRETERVLERAGEGSLYPKRLRDSIIMIALNRRLDTVWKVNELLAEHREKLLS